MIFSNSHPPTELTLISPTTKHSSPPAHWLQPYHTNFFPVKPLSDPVTPKCLQTKSQWVWDPITGASSPPITHTFGLPNTKPQPQRSQTPPKPPNHLLQHFTITTVGVSSFHNTFQIHYHCPNPHRHGAEIPHFSPGSVPDTADLLCQSFAFSPDQPASSHLSSWVLFTRPSTASRFLRILPQMEGPTLAPALQ